MNRWQSMLPGAVAVALSFAGSAWAHHGTAGSYDQGKLVTVNGIVKEFRWRNPHSALFIEAKDAGGKTVIYALEMGSPATLVKYGYTRTFLKAGDELVIDMHPSFTNPTSGEALSRKLVINGKLVEAAKAEPEKY